MNEIRKVMRKKRKSLTNEIRDQASKKIVDTFLTLENLKKYNTIAVYLAFDGEIDLNYIIQWCWKNHKTLYLPIITETKIMHFAKYQPQSILKKNKFGILEPEGEERIEAEELDLVLLPLIAFDKNNHRLGMGQGFYDATLQKLKKRPVLIGVGYDFQCVDKIIPQPHDVRLDGVLTENISPHIGP